MDTNHACSGKGKRNSNILKTTLCILLFADSLMRESYKIVQILDLDNLSFFFFPCLYSTTSDFESVLFLLLMLQLPCLLME